MIVARKKMVWICNGSGGRGGSVHWSLVFIKAVFKSSFRFTYVVFRVAVDTIINGSHFPSDTEKRYIRYNWYGPRPSVI